MSLVAYIASDESDASDAEDEKTDLRRPNVSNSLAGHISDDEEYERVSSTSITTSTGTSSSVNASGTYQSVNMNANNSDDSVNSTSVLSLDDLPAPQPKISASLLEEEEDELEEAVKPKESEIASAPKPPKKKTKQTVKITIPSLNETPLDEETETKKRPEPSKTKSGLFSLLPAPMHSAKKEINRPLIPHSLTKKTVPAKPANNKNIESSSFTSKNSSEVASTSNKSSKHMTPFNALTGYDSDSDEEEEQGSSVNFFSLNESSEVKALDRITPLSKPGGLQSEEVSSSELDLKSVDTDISKQSTVVKSGDENKDNDNAVEEEVGPEPGAVNDAPLNFNSINRFSSWSGSSYGYLAPVGLAGPVPPSAAYASYQTTYAVPSNAQYNLVNTELQDETNEDETGAVADDDLKQFMSDKEFQKFQGKRKRGLEEAISFVDANVDDYVDPSEVSKHLTEETEYVSKKNKDNLPTAQQKRKKQITYLAYQAKERELELKNAWAANRMTKKQTQSKYGF